MRKVAILVLLAAAVAASAAVGGAKGQRRLVAAHPRIWLDPATLKTLRARARANTAEWQKLKAVCSDLLHGPVEYPDGNAYPDTGIGEGYQGDGYWPAMIELGLCAQTAPSGRTAYAQRVATLLAAMSAPAHEPDPLRDDGYGIRFYVSAMAIGYDWAHAALSSSLRKQVIAALHRWIRAFESGGFERDYPQGNYFAGYYDAKALAALATLGEDKAAAQEWKSWLDDQFGKMVQPYYAANLVGGGWPEGWNYGPLATMNMLWPVDAARTTTGTDLRSRFPYAVDAAKFVLNFTWPGLRSLDDMGIQHETDDPSAADPWLATTLAGELSRLGSSYAPYMQDYARRVRAANPDLTSSPTWGPWVDFLYWNPRAPSKKMTTLPRSYFARGMGMASMRSSWKTGAVWAEYKAAPYTGNPDAAEEFFDEGSLEILSGSHEFLVYAPSALMRNTPGTDDGAPYENLINDDLFSGDQPRDLFNVFMTSRPTPTGQGERTRADGARTATAFADHGSYAVARTTHLEDLYPQNPNDPKGIASWSREVVYVRPRLFVVHDHTVVTRPVPDQWLGWSFLGRPQRLADGRYQLTQGTAQPVLPAGHVQKIVNVFGSNKVYRLEVRPGDQGTTHDWITVFWVGKGSVAARPVAVSGGTGVRVGSVTVKFTSAGVSVQGA